MKRRNYIQSVASLPALSTFSLPSTSESDEEESEFNIHAMWHRGRGDGHISTEDYFHEYTDYRKWKASTVVFSSLREVDIVPKLTRIGGTRLISVTDHPEGHTRVLLTAENEELDIALSTQHMNEVKFVHDTGENYYIDCENLADVRETIGVSV